jgi:2-hydroxychromene-2-carboxylate isomerase
MTTLTMTPSSSINGSSHGTTSTASTDKPTWKIFWDLQCPYSKKAWEKLPQLKERFGHRYEFETHITSIMFHRQDFPAHCAACLIGTHKGPRAKQAFVDACFANQERFHDAAVTDFRPSELAAVFANIAKEAGLLDEGEGGAFTEAYFVEHMDDWKEAAQPAWDEHKFALGQGVFRTVRFVVNGTLVEDTQSGWGPDEWEDKLKAIGEA